MRIPSFVAAALLVTAALLVVGSLSSPALADLCGSCKGKAYTKDVGTCGECGGPTSSGQFALCLACSGKRLECEHCKAALGAPPAAVKEDLTKEGAVRSGRWEYRLRIGNAGSRSEGRFGDLLVDAQPVAAPADVNDHLRTPWGLLWWVGNPPVAFGAHGWMTKPAPSKPRGRLLPDPAGATQVVVWMTVLEARTPAPDAAALEPWIAQGLSAQGVKEATVVREAVPLGAEAVLLHDTKLHGRAEARLLRAEASKPVAVEVSGTAGAPVELPCTQGETRVVKRAMASPFRPLDLWLAFQVEVSVPADR